MSSLIFVDIKICSNSFSVFIFLKKKTNDEDKEPTKNVKSIKEYITMK